ncbi:MAG: glycosyltransferase family 4 protein [Desulfurococcus sp.]|uniref:glycosyltransferase family 4 protein n=1 Tax=Desulfurococcus sp. TaxID=51678 RepID=UPI00317DF093
MKVALISSGLLPVPPRKGGAVELYAIKLIEALRRLDVEAYVIDRLWNNTNKSDKVIRVKVPTTVDSEILTNILGRSRHLILKEIVFGFYTSSALREFDIIHANTAWVGYTLAHMIHKLRARFVYTCHNPLWPEENVYFGERVVRVIESYTMKKANAVIALNETMKRALTEKAGVNQDKIFVVPNGVDIEFFKPGLKCDEINAKYGLEGKRVVLFVGRVTHGKGVHVLLEAVRILKDKHGLRDVKVVIVGPLSGSFGNDTLGDYARVLREYAIKNNIDAVFTGSLGIEELRYLYSCSHVLVLPSYFEVFPMVLIEAMASGLPVIGSKAGGIVDIVKNGVNGYLFEKVQQMS